MGLRRLFFSMIVLILSSTAFAFNPHLPPAKKVEKSPAMVVAPGTRLVNGENQDEFYILDRNEPDPVKPKPIEPEKHKAWVYKVQINKVLVEKPKKETKLAVQQKTN